LEEVEMRGRFCLLVASLLLVPDAAPLADDVVVQLGPSDSFVINDSTPFEEFRIDEEGQVFRNGGVRFMHDFGIGNTFVGSSAGNFSLIGGSATNNTGLGLNVLQSLTTGNSNSAFGTGALAANQSGNANSAFGLNALTTNTTGFSNAAFGSQALTSNTGGFANAGFGTGALQANMGGTNNAAFGQSALNSNTSGSNNSAFGRGALISNTTGGSNSAFGVNALSGNDILGNNSAFGLSALQASTGSGNASVGAFSLDGLTSGNNNIALGVAAGTTLTSGSSNIYIGNTGQATESGTIRIGAQGTHGNTFVQGISGNPVAGDGVLVTAGGELGVLLSSQRFKEQVRDVDATDTLMALRPVSFQYREEYAGTDDRTHYGLIAEEVAKVAPELVRYDEEGRPFTVRYQNLAPMLLSQMQKQQELIERLEKRVAELESR